MADVARMIGENIAALANGPYMISKWMDEAEKQDDELDGDAIAADIIKRAGLKLPGQEINNDESV